MRLKMPLPRSQIRMSSAAALKMHGDALGVREDVFLDGNGDVGERVISEQVGGDFHCERLDEAARAGGGEGLDL